MYRLHHRQRLRLDRQSCWEFFSDPRNLTLLTPPWLGFDTSRVAAEPMYAGMILEYRVTPFLGIPMGWVTEITHVQAPDYFVDEQRFGPYRFWHHQHRFRPIAGGVEVEDLVHYLVPGGPIGWALHGPLVGRSLARIFAYRRQWLAQRFGELADSD